MVSIDKLEARQSIQTDCQGIYIDELKVRYGVDIWICRPGSPRRLAGGQMVYIGKLEARQSMIRDSIRRDGT